MVVGVFVPQAIKRFRFCACEFDAGTGVAQFRYAFDDVIEFTETFTFPIPNGGAHNVDAARRAVFLLSLLAGISYYKAAVPPTLRIESGPITDDEQSLLETFYFEGLGEFAFVNRIHLRNQMHFEAERAVDRSPLRIVQKPHALVAVGGGKDSCVSIEMVRSSGIAVTLASINSARPIRDVIAAAGLPNLVVQRNLSQSLFDINAQGALNGHVPVTGIVSAALYVTALLHGYNAVVMSNERSASVGNLEWDGRVVNHQWSKSFAAEQMLAGLFAKSITRDIAYFSLLRPYSELAIAARFADLDHYHSVFTSCNRAFAIDSEKRIDRWCCNCPKCRFVFLALATQLEPGELRAIFGVDMLCDDTQTTGFEALLGWDAAKPFECVGETEESIGAFLLLRDNPKWRNHSVVRHVNDVIVPKLPYTSDQIAHLKTQPFVPSKEHAIPSPYRRMFDEDC